ncbi:MAG: hypothetical protein IKV77_11015 [Alistipes sp.]|nr:hypothetical protein [Alistipes sp.]
MRNIIIIFSLLIMAGCSMLSRLEKQQSYAIADYAPRKEQEQKTKMQSGSNTAILQDSATFYLTEAVRDTTGELIMSLNVDEVVVVAKSRTITERNGKVLIDFVITLPKELQGNCQSVSVVPHLHKNNGRVPLQELSIRGGLFSRVQDRNYWQYGQYVKRFKPDAAQRAKAYNRFVKYPYLKGVRLDSIVENVQTISYYYTQEVSTSSEGKTMLITLQGEVVGLDGSRYTLPVRDTLEYNISSMLTFVDHTTRYKTKVIEKYAVVRAKNYLAFPVGKVDIVDTLADNASQIRHIDSLMNELINQREFFVDSIILTASASPEGALSLNEKLARGRAQALKQRLVHRFGDEVDSLISIRWVAEDWEELLRLIQANDSILHKEQICALIYKHADTDKRESAIRQAYPEQYKYIKRRLYPLLRSVNFKYDLRRRGMVKDTIHTTIIDTLYARSVELLDQRRYEEALNILQAYDDRNTAVAMLSLGFDEQAYRVLMQLKEDATVAYLRAIACVRLQKIDEGRKHFKRACELQSTFEYRGRLDPEISILINSE